MADERGRHGAACEIDLSGIQDLIKDVPAEVLGDEASRSTSASAPPSRRGDAGETGPTRRCRLGPRVAGIAEAARRSSRSSSSSCCLPDRAARRSARRSSGSRSSPPSRSSGSSSSAPPPRSATRASRRRPLRPLRAEAASPPAPRALWVRGRSGRLQLVFLAVFAVGLVLMARQAWNLTLARSGFRYGFLYRRRPRPASSSMVGLVARLLRGVGDRRPVTTLLLARRAHLRPHDAAVPVRGRHRARRHGDGRARARRRASSPSRRR